MVDPKGEVDQGAVVWGDLCWTRMYAEGVEDEDIGLVIVLRHGYQKQLIHHHPRHRELFEAEWARQGDIKLQTQAWRQRLSIPWATGAERRSCTDGTHRDQTTWEWQILCCQ